MAMSEPSAIDLVFQPLRIALSKPAWRAYIGIILFTATSSILLGLAFVSYGFFYTSYVPQINVERVVHLQFGTGFPFGVAYLDGALVSKQPYDVLVHLDLPRSPSNLAAGNFMLDLALLSTAPTSLTSSNADEGRTVAHSRRTTLLTYTSPLVDYVTKTATVPWLMLGWTRESEQLHVPMMEKVELGRTSSQLPRALRLEIQTVEKLTIYSARVEFVARFKGIRWLMYNHRIISLLVFSTLFYTTSLLSAAGVWVVFWTHYRSIPATTATNHADHEIASATLPSRIKEDDVEIDSVSMSDTPRTFPTSSRQPRLRYLPTPRMTPEQGDDEDTSIRASIEEQPFAVEADDEDDILDGSRAAGRTDSGIGTSLEEGSERAVRRRQRSRAW